MLSNFQVGERALLQSFLLGQPEFREKWATDPNLEQLRQRVIAIHHLQAMTEDETRDYILHRLQLVGWKEDPKFTDGAFRIIFEKTDGVPRRVNTLCSRILLYGAIEEIHDINEDVINAVVEDMESDHEAGRQQAENAVNATRTLREKLNKDSVELDKLKRQSPNGKAGPEDVDALTQRIELLEKYVKAHDLTIKQALEVVTDWLEASDQKDGA